MSEAMTMRCPVDGCERGRSAGMLMCRHHWFMTSKPLRDDVWRTYRKGVRDASYRDAARAAVAAVELQEASYAESEARP